MADDRHYVPGDHYVLDDNSGFKVRSRRARLQWNNILTAPAHFNPRQPQDLVVGVKDDQSVAMARPRQVNQFTVVGTYVTAPAARGATSITVADTAGFNVGDSCQVMLDSGLQFGFTLAAIDGASLSWTGAGLPDTVGALHGDPPENSVLDLNSALVPVNETPVAAY